MAPHLGCRVLPSWRTQILPDTKAVLRHWYIHHGAHPYPLDEEKHELVFDSGVTFAQVTTWFGNTRKKVGNDIRLLQRDQAVYNMELEQTVKGFKPFPCHPVKLLGQSNGSEPPGLAAPSMVAYEPGEIPV